MEGMYCITNRILKKKGNGMDFKDTNELSQSLQFCRTAKGKKLEVIPSEKLFAELRDNETDLEFLLYIHGFNNQPWQDILPNAARMQKQLDTAGLGHIRVVSIIWPCDDDFGIIKDYWDDQETAEFSGEFLARAIAKLMKWQEKNTAVPCMKRIHAMPHSMGNRVLAKALAYFAKTYGGGGVPYLFKNTFLMAADIPNEALAKGEEGHHICSASQQVVCYYANDDLAMPASKISNVKNGVFSRRLGHTGPETWSGIPEGKVLAANCDDFNNKFDPKGHTYFIDKKKLKSPAFQHMITLMKGGRINADARHIDLKLED